MPISSPFYSVSVASSRAQGASEVPARSDPLESPLLKLLTDIGVVVTLLTALFYYFGWVRTRFQARELGFDVSALNLTTADYLLKSLNVLFVPLILLTLCGLAAHQIHVRIVMPALQAGRHARWLRIARVLAWAWVPMTVIAGLLLLTAVAGYAIPVSLTVAILCGMYGRSLRRGITGEDPWPTTTKVIVAVLLVLAVFWTAERVARTTGKAFGADYAANPDQLPAVVVYTEKDLRLGSQGVRATSLPGKDASFQFRYTGLRLLERSGDRYFFITEHPGRVIILRESDDLRMEFADPAEEK
jgi:hypothetical protein